MSEVSNGSTGFKGRNTVVEEWLLRGMLDFAVSSCHEIYLMVSCLSTNLDVLAVKIMATYVVVF